MSTLTEQLGAIERRAEDLDRSALVWACIRSGDGLARSCADEAQTLRDAAATLRRVLGAEPAGRAEQVRHAS